MVFIQVFTIWALGKFARDYAPHFELSTNMPSKRELKRIASIGAAPSSDTIDDAEVRETRSGRLYSPKQPKGIKPATSEQGNTAKASTSPAKKRTKPKKLTFVQRIPYALYAVVCVAAPVYCLHLISDAITDHTSSFVPVGALVAVRAATSCAPRLVRLLMFVRISLQCEQPHRTHPNCTTPAGCPWPDPTHML